MNLNDILKVFNSNELQNYKVRRANTESMKGKKYKINTNNNKKHLTEFRILK